jgi:hypothetical protein
MIGGPALVPSDQNDHGPRTCLTLAEADRLRKAFKSGAGPAVLANRFGISIRTVYRYVQAPAYRCRECGSIFVRRAQAMEHAIENVVTTIEPTLEPPPAVADVPADFATHVTDTLRRRGMRPGLLAHETGLPIDLIHSIMAGETCPDRPTWMRICVVIGTPAQVAQRREWAPVVLPRSEAVPTAHNAPYRRGDVRR